MGKQNRTTPKYPQMQTKEWQAVYNKRMGVRGDDTRKRAKNINDYMEKAGRDKKGAEKGKGAARPAAKRGAAKPAAKRRSRSTSLAPTGH